MSVRDRFALCLLVVGSFGCASGSATPAGPAPSERGPVPAGVDSAASARADSLADVSFVDEASQDEALALQERGQLIVERTDSMWTVMAEMLEAAQPVPEGDSLAARDAATEGGVALVALDSLIRTSDLDTDELTARSALLLDSAEVALERAFQLNPFDSRSRVWLAQVYGLQARRLGQTEAYARAIAELEKLALLTPDQHTVFAMLANNYFYVSNWDGAALNYETAEEVYRETYDLVDEPQALDSAVVFSYVQAQGDMHVKRLDASRASEAYDRALRYAKTADDSTYIAGELEWMAWDDMNIRSAFTRDSLLSLEQAGDLEGARRGYADLLAGLGARAAIDETDWRLAIVDYNLGAAEPAAARLQELVARTPIDSGGAPLDSEYARYFDDYGTLCMNLGRTFRLEQRDRRTALKYFTQATMLTWSGEAVAHFEIARLVQSNVGASMESALRALEDEAALSEQQQGDLYRLLMELSRRTGDFEGASRYRDAYRALRGGEVQ